MSVQASQSSVNRGATAAYVVQVSTQNGSASDVTVALTAQPSTQKPTFTSGCAKGGTATCTVSALSDTQPTVLHAQIPVAADATSVTSVKLTATASVATAAKWTPPSATATVAVTAATPAPSASAPVPSASAPAASSPAGALPGTALPLGPVPYVNGAASSVISSSLIGANNASGLFPAIVPSATPSPAPGVQPKAPKRGSRSVAVSSTLALQKPALTAQLAGLIALAVAVLLTVTRLSFLRRLRSRKQGG